MTEVSLKDLLKDVPGINKSEDGNPVLWVRFVEPLSEWEWYITEIDPATYLCYGYIKTNENEWGFFSITDLISMGCAVDIGFKSVKFNDFCKGREVQ